MPWKELLGQLPHGVDIEQRAIGIKGDQFVHALSCCGL